MVGDSTNTIRKPDRTGITRTIAMTLFLACAAGGALMVDAAAPAQAAAQDVDDGYFYASLAPHGDWFFQADFGWVWHPTQVGAGWRPYTEGQWVWAEGAGWTWASDEPWGWATYHYGRWYFDPSYGWSWVPGRTWAPAWVSWRVDAGYIGWAPLWPVYFDLHPEYRWDRWDHDSDWDRRHQGRDWDRWVFTRDRDFTSDRVGRMAIGDHRERDTIFGRSRDVTQYDESHPERMAQSIDRRVIERAAGHPVRSVTFESVDKPVASGHARGDRLQVFRPRVNEAPDKTPDRLGFAKPPSKEARETDTIRQEKTRLDSRPDKGQDRGGRGHATREKDNERGGGAGAGAQPAAVEPAKDGRPAANAPAGEMRSGNQRQGGAGGRDNANSPADLKPPRAEQAQRPASEPKHEGASAPVVQPQAAPRHDGYGEQPRATLPERLAPPDRAREPRGQPLPDTAQERRMQPAPERTQEPRMRQAPPPHAERQPAQDPSMRTLGERPREQRPATQDPQAGRQGGQSGEQPRGERGGAPSAQPQQHQRPQPDKNATQGADPNQAPQDRGQR